MAEKLGVGDQVRARLVHIADRGHAADQRRLRQGQPPTVGDSYIARAITTVARANGMSPQEVAQAYTDDQTSQAARELRESGATGGGSLRVRQEHGGKVIYDASTKWRVE